MTNSEVLPTLVAKNVSKEFGYRRVLENVNLALYNHKFTLLLGRNGSGKSTLLKIMTGLMRPTKGDILHHQEKIIESPNTFRGAIGFITHNSNFYGDLSAEENLLFAAKMRKLPNIKETIRQVLSQTGLEKFSDARVKIFSSGMVKRLNIARLLLLRPEILLLDEPYTGLDYDSIAFFNQYLADFKNMGGAILMISHQIETCYELADDIAIMENKSIQRYISSDKLSYDQLVKEYHHLTN